MKKKRVQIDTPASTVPGERMRSGQVTPTESAIPQSRTGVPRQLLPPSRDGYLSPRIEMSELQNRNPITPQQGEELSRNSSFSRLPYTPPLFSGRQSANPSSSSLAHSLLEKLQWKERIRHYTWTFFAMTMAVSCFT